MWELMEIWNFLNTCISKQNFLNNKNLFKKNEVPFLVESTKIKSAAFPCKTALSEANVKTN